MQIVFKIFVVILFLHVIFSEIHSQVQYQVDPINKVKLEKILSERNGKPLLLNIWATWCIPCREEFPDLIKLKGEFGDKVDFIAISADYPDEVNDKIIPFLKEVKADFEIYVNDFKVKSDLIDFLEKDWNGALPATFIYDSKGKRKYFFQGVKSYTEFKKILSQF